VFLRLVHFGLSAQPDLLSILAHQLRRRFLPNSSLLRGAGSTYSTARPEGSLVFRCPACPLRTQLPELKSCDLRPETYVLVRSKPSDVPRPFLG
jgi:hypothetical protein